MNSNELYNKIKNTSSEQSPRILYELKQKAFDYFENLSAVGPIFRLNMNSKIKLFYCPLMEIYGSFLMHVPSVSGVSKIYVDEKVLETNPQMVERQLLHEVLHALSSDYYGMNRIVFSHVKTGNDFIYTGINEATTQMFTDDIIGNILEEKDNYLYFIENIMKILKVLFGTKLIADQYFSNNEYQKFERVFSNESNTTFESFALLINEVYNLNKEKFYRGLDEESIETLKSKEEELLYIINNLITIYAEKDNTIIEKILLEIPDERFLKQINIFSTIENQSDEFKSVSI